VRRSSNPADRRSLLVEITPAGLTIVQELRTIVHRHEKAWMSGLSDPELRSYIEQLHVIQDTLTAAAEEAREVFERVRARVYLERLDAVMRLSPEADTVVEGH
jgi:DNA-binding MarR family transcriptional regulator